MSSTAIPPLPNISTSSNTNDVNPIGGHYFCQDIWHEYLLQWNSIAPIVVPTEIAQDTQDAKIAGIPPLLTVADTHPWLWLWKTLTVPIFFNSPALNAEKGDYGFFDGNMFLINEKVWLAWVEHIGKENRDTMGIRMARMLFHVYTTGQPPEDEPFWQRYPIQKKSCEEVKALLQQHYPGTIKPCGYKHSQLDDLVKAAWTEQVQARLHAPDTHAKLTEEEHSMCMQWISRQASHEHNSQWNTIKEAVHQTLKGNDPQELEFLFHGGNIDWRNNALWGSTYCAPLVGLVRQQLNRLFLPVWNDYWEPAAWKEDTIDQKLYRTKTPTLYAWLNWYEQTRETCTFKGESLLGKNTIYSVAVVQSKADSLHTQIQHEQGKHPSVLQHYVWDYEQQQYIAPKMMKGTLQTTMEAERQQQMPLFEREGFGFTLTPAMLQRAPFLSEDDLKGQHWRDYLKHTQWLPPYHRNNENTNPVIAQVVFQSYWDKNKERQALEKGYSWEMEVSVFPKINANDKNTASSMQKVPVCLWLSNNALYSDNAWRQHKLPELLQHATMASHQNKKQAGMALACALNDGDEQAWDAWMQRAHENKWNLPMIMENLLEHLETMATDVNNIVFSFLGSAHFLEKATRQIVAHLTTTSHMNLLHVMLNHCEHEDAHTIAEAFEPTLVQQWRTEPELRKTLWQQLRKYNAFENEQQVADRLEIWHEQKRLGEQLTANAELESIPTTKSKFRL